MGGGVTEHLVLERHGHPLRRGDRRPQGAPVAGESLDARQVGVAHVEGEQRLARDDVGRAGGHADAVDRRSAAPWSAPGCRPR